MRKKLSVGAARVRVRARVSFGSSRCAGREFSAEMAEGCSREYLSCTSREISSLWDLEPGDHIRVRGELGEFLDTYSSDLKVYTHHMLVVAVKDSSHVRVIHKTLYGVEEETREYKPSDITVLDYECPYTGDKAIQRARELKMQSYNLVSSNCEHFVTEVRTGEKLSSQVRTAVKVAVGAAIGVGVIAGALWYALNSKSSSSARERRDSDSDPENDHDYTDSQHAF